MKGVFHKEAILLFLTVLLVASTISGCAPVFRYEGHHTDLAVTAIYSIPGVESSSGDQVLLLDQDSFGRTVFAVILTRNFLLRQSFGGCVLAVMVMQQSDNTQVYFYPEQNYILSLLPSKTMLNEKLIGIYFTDEAISQLKIANN